MRFSLPHPVARLARRLQWPAAGPLSSSALGRTLACTLAIGLTLGGMLLLLFRALDEVDQRDRAAQMVAASQAVTAALEQAGRFALAQAEMQARRADVAAALAAGDATALMGLSAAGYEYLNTQAGVNIYGYHTADMRYLLRVHRKRVGSDGDDISRRRPMVLSANKSRQPQLGLEIGVTGIPAVRGITTVQRDGQFVGTMEVGMDLLPIIERIKVAINADVAVILSQSLAGMQASKDSGEVFGDLILSASTDNALFARLLQAKAVPVTRDTRIVQAQVHGVNHSVVIQPLTDFSGRVVGSLVAVKDFSAQQAQIRQTRTDLTVAALCGGVLAFVLFAVLCRASVARDERA